ncbi:MAG TPA: 2-C-methyl-D-erythritol 4-phosphate cytidylyltransferase [Candidatus Baltobacteraceae bacterium]
MTAAASWAAVIVAAGRGTRFGRPKQFLELAGLPMVGWSIRTFAGMPEIDEVVIATEIDWIERMRELSASVAPHRTVTVVAGGSSRQASVFAGVRAVSERCDAAFVHDGARPLVREDDVRAGMAEVRAGRAALLAAPVVDTIKVVDAATRAVRETLDRSQLWAAQTPQFALRSDLLRAHERALADGIDATDDAALLERIGVEVAVVASTTENFKVTLPEDVARAEAFLRERIAG